RAATRQDPPPCRRHRRDAAASRTRWPPRSPDRGPPRQAPGGAGWSCADRPGRSHPGPFEDRHEPRVAIDPQPVTGVDHLGPDPGGGHRWQPVLTRDDRGMGHDPAAVRYGRDDPGEDDRPARRGERADEDLTVAKLVQLFHLAYDPGHALGDA